MLLFKRFEKIIDVCLYFELLRWKFVKDSSVVFYWLELELISYEGVREVFAGRYHCLERGEVFVLDVWPEGRFDELD